MNKLSLRFLPALAAVAVASTLSLAVATIVDAQTLPPPDSPRPTMPGGPMMHGEHGEHGGPGMHMMKEADGLKKSLQLNASQSALWDKAIAQMKPPADLRETMKADHERMTTALSDPNFDPRKLSAEMERADTERRARMATTREAWFAVYDSLNPVQRGQVREFLREKMSRGMHRMGWMHHHDGGHADEHGGWRGGMAPGRPGADGAPMQAPSPTR